MKVLCSEKRLCLSCMQEHIIDVVETEEHETFNGVKVKFSATYEYCTKTDEYLETEAMIKANGLAVKDAYRKAVGLLTSAEIKCIREKYSISQKEFSEVLDWGKATIIRYENNQIQDRAHDDILRRIESDPKWFMEMLERAKGKLSRKLYIKYHNAAYEQYAKIKGGYICKAISTTTVVDVVSSKKELAYVEKCNSKVKWIGSYRSTNFELQTAINEKLIFAT